MPPKSLEYLGKPVVFPVSQGSRPLQHVPFWSVSNGEFCGDPEKQFVINPIGLTMDSRFGLLTKYMQTWSVSSLSIGDLVGEFSLSPGEKTEFETRRVERRITEQSREYSTQIESGSESESVDKESLSVVSTAAQSNQWSQTSQHGWNVGAQAQYEGVSANASMQDSNQQSTIGATSKIVAATAEKVHQQTVKATQKLSTSTKTAFRAVTELHSETRQRREITNPRRDAVMHVFGYELVKTFDVVTFVSQVQSCLILLVKPMSFDAKFVAANIAFLQRNLVDASLVDILADAASGAALRIAPQPQSAESSGISILEAILFQDEWQSLSTNNGAAPGKSNIPEINAMTVGAIVKQVEKTGWDSFWSAVDGTGQKKNVVVQAEATKESTGQKIESEQNDKVADALLVGKKYSGMVSLFLEWKIIRAMFLADQKSPVRSAYDAQRAQLLGKFVADIGRFWDEIEVAAKAELLFKSGDEGFMEWARRLDVAASLSSALLPAQNAASYSPDPTLQLQALDRLLQHLNQLSGFYTAKYIGHQYHTLGSDWLVPLVNEACSWVFHGKAVDPCIDPVSPWKDAYDPEDIRFRGSEIIVPMLRPTSSLSDDYYVDYCWDQAASLNGSLATSAEIVDKGLMGDEVATAKLQALLPATTNPRSEAAGKKPPRSGGEQPIAWDEVKVVVEGVHLSASFELAPNVGSGST